MGSQGQAVRKRLIMIGVAALCGYLAISFAQRVSAERNNPLLHGPMKTVCVGRFLIDVPATLEVTIRGGFIAGYDMWGIRESDDKFRDRLGEMEAKVKAKQKESGGPDAEWSQAISFGSTTGKVLMFGRERGQLRVDGRRVEYEDFSVNGLLRFPGVSVAAEAERQALERGAELVRLFGRLRPLADGEIPREPGFCMGQTMVRDPYENSDTERVVMFAGLREHPDVNIVFSSMAGTSPAPGLIERNAKAATKQPFFMRLAFSTLRERQRTLNGLAGEELALKVREPNFTTGYSFQWEMAGNQHDIRAPHLSLELESGTNPVSGGKPVQSSLSESEMSQLWDRIASSVRLRPGSAAHTAAHASR